MHYIIFMYVLAEQTDAQLQTQRKLGTLYVSNTERKHITSIKEIKIQIQESNDKTYRIMY